MRGKLLKKFVGAKEDILHLIYPEWCYVCQKELAQSEDYFCIFCTDELHYTGHEKLDEASALDKLFWGRCQIERTFALLHFSEEGSTQKILHEIKYKGKENLAIYMGKLLAEKASPIIKNLEIDALIPVPLHPKKEFIRGYNQSERIAQGISEASGIPLDLEFLRRVKHAESQTKKNKFLRWDAIQDTFVLREEDKSYRHIALVDDVVTTGSTLESIVKQIHAKHAEMKISILSLAITT